MKGLDARTVPTATPCVRRQAQWAAVCRRENFTDSAWQGISAMAATWSAPAVSAWTLCEAERTRPAIMTIAAMKILCPVSTGPLAARQEWIPAVYMWEEQTSHVVRIPPVIAD